MIPTKLVHYSENPIEKLDENFLYTDPVISKPKGFWFSVEDYEDDETWKTWCEAEQFNLEGLKHKHFVVLSPQARILHLKTKEEIYDFGLQYQATVAGGFYKGEYVHEIKWDEVMKQYDGIIIAPYRWTCRLLPETAWYYPWDCASGCIWNLSVIDSIQEETQVCQEGGSAKDSHTGSQVHSL